MQQANLPACDLDRRALPGSRGKGGLCAQIQPERLQQHVALHDCKGSHGPFAPQHATIFNPGVNHKDRACEISLASMPWRRQEQSADIQEHLRQPVVANAVLAVMPLLCRSARPFAILTYNCPANSSE